MDIAGGLGALKKDFDISNAIRQRIKEEKLFPNEILEQLLNLQQAMLESQTALNDAAEQIRLLKEELSRRDRAAELEKDLEYVNDGGFYIRKSEHESAKDIRYCPACWGKDGRLVPLNPGSGHGLFTRNIHKVEYETRQY